MAAMEHQGTTTSACAGKVENCLVFSALRKSQY